MPSFRTVPKFSQTFAYLLGFVFRQLFELAQYAAGNALLDGREQRTFLDHLARHVKRQVGRIDDAAHEAQIARQNLGLVGDEDPLDVELYAPSTFRIEEIERSRAGMKVNAVYSCRPSARKWIVSAGSSNWPATLR